MSATNQVFDFEKGKAAEWEFAGMRATLNPFEVQLRAVYEQNDMIMLYINLIYSIFMANLD